MKIIKTSQAMPEAGEYVLAWLENTTTPMRAMWVAQFTLPVGEDADLEWCEYCEEKDEYFCPAGWYEMNRHEEQHWSVDGNVVAWCELPRLDHRCLAQIEEPAQPIAGYRISDPSDPTIKPWLSETHDDNGYTSEPLYAGAAPAAVAPLPAVFEQIAQSWDGCMYDAPGETLDIGADIRAAAKRLLAEHPAAVAPQGDEDDSLLLCASDLQHSAIYDSHSEMQDCARSVADRIKALAARAQAAPALEAPAAPPVPVDEFRGDTPSLVRNIVALLELDADGALVPHGVGGHARGLLSAAAARLSAAPQAPAALDELRQIADIAACWGCDHPDAPGDTELLRRIKWAARQLRAVSQAPVAPVAPAEPAGKAHDWRENASYGGEICAECGATKGSRRGNAPCTWPPAKTAKRWPFLESPGEFTARLEAAIRSFGGLLPAVRNVLIEHPPTLVAAPAAPSVDAELLELAQAIVKFNKEHGSVLAVHINNLADLLDERAAQAKEGGA